MRSTDASGSARVETRQSSLDWLRLLLAVQVVLIHVFGLHPFVGVYPVGAFVCISGYLIPSSYARSRSWGHFAWKRALRVVPVFLLSLVLVAVIAPDQLAVTLLAYLTMNIRGGRNANGVLWSLMAEEVLYAFHGLTRALYGRSLAWVCLGLSMLAIWADVPYSYLAVVAGSFFAGNLIGLYSAWRSLRLWQTGALLLAVVAGQTVLTGQARIAEVERIGLPIIGAVLVVLVTLRLRLPPLKADYSYSLYALHLPVLALIRMTPLPRVPALLLIMPVVCSVVWRFVEAPVLKLKDAGSPSSPSAA